MCRKGKSEFSNFRNLSHRAPECQSRMKREALLCQNTPLFSRRRVWGFSSWVQMWEIQLAVLLDSLILKTTALDIKNRMQSVEDSGYWHVSCHVPAKHQWFMLTPLYLTSSIFIHIPKNRTRSLVQLTEWGSGDCLTQCNFPTHQQSCGLLLAPGKQTWLWNGTMKEIIGRIIGRYWLYLT